MKRLLAAFALTIITSPAVSAEGALTDPKITPAYKVLVLRKAAVEAELVSLSGMFASQHPDVQDKRFELNVLSLEIEKMQVVRKSSVLKLSDTYGNLTLRKVSLEVELNNLLRSFKPQHPDVEKKRVMLAALARELESILR